MPIYNALTGQISRYVKVAYREGAAASFSADDMQELFDMYGNPANQILSSTINIRMQRANFAIQPAIESLDNRAASSAIIIAAYNADAGGCTNYYIKNSTVYAFTNIRGYAQDTGDTTSYLNAAPYLLADTGIPTNIDPAGNIRGLFIVEKINSITFKMTMSIGDGTNQVGAAFMYQSTSTGYTHTIYERLTELTEYDPEDPYTEAGISETGGGDGTFDFSDTPIDHPNEPTIGAYNTGFVTLYSPSEADLQALAQYMWSGAFDPATFKKLVADPMDVILGLSILPVTPPSAPATLSVGNISTGLNMPRVTRQYVPVECGSVSILPKWGAYLDFSPYSKLQLYLPFVGVVDISPDDCMNGSISVKYIVDVLSGTFNVTVKCNAHVLYEFGGDCSCQCPVTAGQYKNAVSGVLGAVGGIIGAAGGIATGNIGAITGGLESAANSVLSMSKPEVKRSGGIGGSSGLMGIQYPFLILTVPRMCSPGGQNEMIGYPSFISVLLGNLTGYTEIDSIHLSGISATNDELDEIEELLKTGVIF